MKVRKIEKCILKLMKVQYSIFVFFDDLQTGIIYVKKRSLYSFSENQSQDKGIREKEYEIRFFDK